MVMFREPPQASNLTPERFAMDAFEAVPGQLETLGSQWIGGLNESIGLGTFLRDVQTPGLAKKPVPGEHYYVWKDETSQEVKARGDTLYNSPEEYKASPYFREKVPFERGMTEARARALAGHTDLAAVRAYFGSKRPYTAFAGRLAGAAFDPINYIPIFGEYTAAGSFARIAIKAGIGAADAAANVGLSSIAMRDRRTKLGYDTSWATLAQDIAFSALAGGLIRGGLAAALPSRLPVPERVATDIQPEAISSAAVRVGKETYTGQTHADAMEAASKSLGKPVDQIFEEHGSGVVTAQVDGFLTTKGRYVSREEAATIAAKADQIDPIGGRSRADSAALVTETKELLAEQLDPARIPDTVANRSKAAVVMNEAIDGMVHEDAPRIGENGKDILQSMRPEPAAQLNEDVSAFAEPAVRVRGEIFKASDYVPNWERGSGDIPKDGDEVVDFGHSDLLQKAIDKHGDEIAKEVEKNPSAFMGSVDRTGRFRSMEELDSMAMAPLIGEILPPSKTRPGAIFSGGREITRQEYMAELKARTPPRQPRPGDDAIDFTSPTPEARDTSATKSAEARLASVQSGDPVAAEIKAAKDEGIDIETGKHDLEADIAQLRERGFEIMDHEEAELKAADAEVTIAKAWGEVLEAARLCVK